MSFSIERGEEGTAVPSSPHPKDARGMEADKIEG